MSQQSRIW